MVYNLRFLFSKIHKILVIFITLASYTNLSHSEFDVLSFPTYIRLFISNYSFPTYIF